MRARWDTYQTVGVGIAEMKRSRRVYESFRVWVDGESHAGRDGIDFAIF